MVMRLSVACDFPCEQADMGEEEPCGGAGNGSLEILCKALSTPTLFSGNQQWRLLRPSC